MSGLNQKQVRTFEGCVDTAPNRIITPKPYPIWTFLLLSTTRLKI